MSLRKLAVVQSTKFLNTVLKRMYLSFVANSKFTSPKSRPLIVLMENCLIEMYNLDHHTTYQHGFVYIRQLAVHLRTAMVQQKKDSYQTVYNWQYIHCIELWCRVLGDCVSETLKPLIYPLVQTTLGVMRLIPTPRYYPLRFHCIHSLNTLADKTNTLIPVAPALLEVLDSTALRKKPRPSTSKPVSFSYILRVSKSQLQTKAFQVSTILLLCVYKFHANISMT
jgi:nucleolar complex protein 2